MITSDLKNSILEFAFSGKLTSQLKTDTKIEDYYNQIELKRNELIKQKKVKKLKEINNKKDAPFPIPDNWKWVNLQEIINVRSAVRVHQSDWKKNGIPFYRAREVVKLSLDGFVDNELFISEELYEKFKKSSGVPHENDLLVSGVGTIGKAYIVKKNDKFYYKDASVICFENFYNINPYYLQYLLQAPFMIKQIQKDAMGTTVATLTMERAYGFLVPLPPIEEQQRIVDRINELFLKLDNIAPIENEIIALRNNFSNDLRKSIIQTACNGNLSIQHDDESVNGILNAIKIKNNKEINIVHNKVPFPIPDNWVWIRFDDLASFDIGKTPARADSTYWGNDYHWISISDMVEDGLIDETKEGVSQKAFDNIFKGKISKKGTLIMSFKLTVGRCSLLNIDAFHNEGIISIYPNYESEILKKYLMKILPFITKYGDTKGAIKGNTLNSKSLKELLIPLPPIEEQQRIIEKIEELLPLLKDVDKIVNS